MTPSPSDGEGVTLRPGEARILKALHDVGPMDRALLREGFFPNHSAAFVSRSLQRLKRRGLVVLDDGWWSLPGGGA